MYKGFMCLIQVMICDKKLGVGKQFHTVPDVTCKTTVQISMKKKYLKHNFFLSKSPIYPEKTQKV